VTTFDYAKPRATADRLLTRFGQAAVLRRPGEGSGDPWNETAGTPGDHPVTVTVFDYTAQDRQGTAIQEFDKRVLMSAQGLEIMPSDSSDTLLIGEQEHAIISVKTLAPAGEAVMFELQVR
jgi:hypothetical protein